MAASPDRTFNIGFALSGAVSAGAYTAGVLDYFFQALHEWEKARTDRVTVRSVPGAAVNAVAL